LRLVVAIVGSHGLLEMPAWPALRAAPGLAAAPPPQKRAVTAREMDRSSTTRCRTPRIGTKNVHTTRCRTPLYGSAQKNFYHGMHYAPPPQKRAVTAREMDRSSTTRCRTPLYGSAQKMCTQHGAELHCTGRHKKTFIMACTSTNTTTLRVRLNCYSNRERSSRLVLKIWSGKTNKSQKGQNAAREGTPPYA